MRMIRTFIAGALTAYFLLSTTFGALIILAAMTFQQNLAAVSPGTNGLISFAALEEVDREIAALLGGTEDIRREYNDLQMQISALEQQRRSHAQHIAAAFIQLGVSNIPATETASGADFRETVRQQLAETSVEGAAEIVVEVDRVTHGLDTLDEQLAPLRARIVQLDPLIAEAESQIRALQQSVVPNSEHYYAVKNQARALQFISLFGLSGYLTQGHPALLSIMLSASMGGLAAAMFVMPGFLTGQAVSIAGVLARLIFGLVAGVVSYILLSTGIQSAVAASAGQQNMLFINPGAISLVAFISGAVSFDLVLWARGAIPRYFERHRR